VHPPSERHTGRTAGGKLASVPRGIILYCLERDEMFCYLVTKTFHVKKNIQPLITLSKTNTRCLKPLSSCSSSFLIIDHNKVPASLSSPPLLVWLVLPENFSMAAQLNKRHNSNQILPNEDECELVVNSHFSHQLKFSGIFMLVKFSRHFSIIRELTLRTHIVTPSPLAHCSCGVPSCCP
jgi:hypothetical protein